MPRARTAQTGAPGRAPGALGVPVAGGTARLVPDPGRSRAWTLLVDGIPQSHVDLADPSRLDFEYVRWLGHLSDALLPVGAPLSAVHLGGGGCTLARYIAATRPGSRQRVVELDAALVELVRGSLPLPPRCGIRIRVGEAREVLASLPAASADLVVLDVFDAGRVPAHLTSREFVTDVARVLRPGGSYAANLPDGSGLAFARSQTATVGQVFGQLCLIGPPGVLRGRGFGNLVLVAGRGGQPVAALARRTAGDPFPARVLDGESLRRFVAGARPVGDADAVPSPPPPVGLFPG